MFKKILIANRGEIACRIARTCRRLGVEAATVHSSADRESLHVKTIGQSIELGGAFAADSYLKIDAVIAAARAMGAEAIHPGFGFLAENPVFARAVEDAGLVFIGPTADIIERLGDKACAKQEAIKVGVPVIPGSEKPSSNPNEVAEVVKNMRLPIMLKAAAGGGGKGMRIVYNLDNLADDIESAMREGQNAFSNSALIVEQLVQKGRHIEIQIAGDGNGNVIHLYERECSLQRRHQKVIEEAPATNFDPNMRNRMAADAVKLGESLNYRGVGTVEFIVSGDEYFFLEVNPRLQVEHPVTEQVTGLDIVEMQLDIACGRGLSVLQEDVQLKGHSVEARIYAEDPASGFLPSTGNLIYVNFPQDGVRVETGVESGSEVTPYYDPMIAKLITHADTRDEALDRLSLALDEMCVFGVATNRAFLKILLALDETRTGTFYTVFIDDKFDEWDLGSTGCSVEIIAIASYFWLRQQRKKSNTEPWVAWSNTGWQFSSGGEMLAPIPTLHMEESGRSEEIRFAPLVADGYMLIGVGAEEVRVKLQPLGSHKYQYNIENRQGVVTLAADKKNVFVQSQQVSFSFSASSYLSYISATAQVSGELSAPMMGTVLKVSAAVGNKVCAGDTVIVIESMKMELRIVSAIDGVVSSINCQEGETVERHAIVAQVKP